MNQSLRSSSRPYVPIYMTTDTYLVDACGARNLAQYTRADALRYRDHLIARGLVGSRVSRVISSIRAVFNFAISEYALDLKNPFVGMYFDKSAGVSKRLPIPIEDIRKVQNQCRLIDDDLRWLVALVSDTGMRGADYLARSLVLCVRPLKFDQLVRQSLREQPPYYTNRSIDL